MSQPLLVIALPLLAAVTAFPAQADYRPSATWLKRVDELHVRADASTVNTVEMLMRIDTAAGVDRYAERRIAYSDSLETLEVLEAWTLTADGRRLAVEPDKIRTLEATDEGTPEFSDAKVKVVIFPAVAVGAQIHLRYRVTQNTPYFPGHATWKVHYPPGMRLLDGKVLIRHDPGVPLRVGAGGLMGAPTGGRVAPEPTDTPGTVRYAFSFSQPKPHPPEPGQVETSDFAPYVHATTFADRAALAAAYQAVSRPQAEPTAAIRALAAELTAGATTEADKVRRLHRWVSGQIRYVSLDIGTGGFVPVPAQTVLEHRYGDCKGMSVLLEALLRSVGIDSSPALVNSGRAMRLPELAIVDPFNHVITYVPSLNLYLDATARFAPMGTLPEEVMDKPVLLTASGQEGRTPRTSPETDTVHSRTWMQVTDTGEVWGSSHAAMRGAEEVNSRSVQFDNLNKRPQAVARSYLARFGETGDGRIEVPDPLDLDIPWEVKATFELDPVLNIPGPSAMAIPVGIAPGLFRWMSTRRPPTERRFPFVCSAYAAREEAELRLPHNVRIQRIPPDATFRQGPLQFSTRYRRAGQLVTVVREFSARYPSHTCAVRDDEDWLAFLRVLQRDLREQVFVR